MGDMLIMSKKERNRKALLEQVVGDYLTLKEAAQKMGISYRHAKRIWRRYTQEGDAGLVHKSREQRSINAYTDEYKSTALKLYKELYYDFGPTLAAEHLRRDHGFEMCTETLRQWLLMTGLWSRHRRRKAYRTRRERRACFGDLLQIDGSIHEWFAGSGQKQCLLNMVDDATGKCYAQLDTGETTHILLRCLYNWISKYGIPKEVYVDLKSVYVSPSSDAGSFFQQVCARLNITIIKAYSPQAKGRVERKHGVFQDRLVKEMRLHNITEIAAANEYLASRFLPQINMKYAKKAKCGENSHRPIAYKELHQLIYQGYERQVQNDWIVQLNNVYYQLEKTQPLQVRTKQKVEIRRHVDNTISIWRKDNQMKFKQLSQKPPSEQEQPTKKGHSESQRSMQATKNRSQTPWGTQDDWLWKKQRKNKSLHKRRRGHF